MPLFPDQQRCLDRLRDTFRAGYRNPLVVAPTGWGKGWVIGEIAEQIVRKGKRVLILTERRAILDQLSGKLSDRGIEHGVYASGHSEDWYWDAHVAMVQTMHGRSRRLDAELPTADVLLVDEARLFTSEARRGLLDNYDRIIGFDATPVNVGGIYDSMIVGASYTECLASGRLVPCKGWSGSEIDMSGVRAAKGEYSDKACQDRFNANRKVIFADVCEMFDRLNPFHKPTAMFAPGTEESVWLCECFKRRGITAEHVDGKTPDDEREQIFARVRSGETVVVSSAGVLSHGVDIPELSHGILLRPCAGVHTYLQLAGRILRGLQENKTEATLQVHTDAWIRHGAPHLDREWKLDDTPKSATERGPALPNGPKDIEPIRCPKCGAMRSTPPFDRCHECGHGHKMSGRRLITVDGELKEMKARPVKQKKEKTEADLWRSCIWAASKSGRTVGQTFGIFKRQNGRWPNVPELPENIAPPSKDSPHWDRLAREYWPWTNKQKAG